MNAVERIADTVLYEGYVLWPYRRSALKNQQRWTFGGVFPAAWSAERPDDRSVMQTEILVEGDDPEVDVVVRFLHVVQRRPARRTEGGGLEPVDELHANGERLLAWEEATEREFAVAGSSADPTIEVPAGETREDLTTGVLVRSWRALTGRIDVETAMLRPGLRRMRVRVENTTPVDTADRGDVLEQTFNSTHAVLTVRRGEFVSLTDPPDALRAEAERCENAGVWPVLVGEPDDRSTILASPIILEDHPQIAPESPQNLFDSGEIDQMLVHNILAMTDEERADMRDCDPRTREILERTERLTPEELMRLHGTVREVGLVRRT